jgi:hypothetical protein
VLDYPGCERRQFLMSQFARMADTERRRREELERRFTRLQQEAPNCQCLKRFLEENTLMEVG